MALDSEVLGISACSLLVGRVGGLLAQAFLELISLLTNLFFSGQWSFAVASPAHHHLGAWVILIPPVRGPHSGGAGNLVAQLPLFEVAALQWKSPPTNRCATSLTNDEL